MSSARIPGNGPDAFSPTCEACRYDLAGLPDGPCPECGRPFRIDFLRAAWENRHHPGSTANSWEFLALLPTAFVQIVFWACLIESPRNTLPVCVLGGLASVLWGCWNTICRRQLLVEHPRHLAAAAILLLPPCLMGIRGLYWNGLIGALPWSLGTMIAWRLCRDRHRCVPFVIAACALAAPGFVGVLNGGTGLMEGRYWSEVDYLVPFWRPMRPLSHWTEFVVGLGFVVLAGVIGRLAIRPR